MPIPVLSAATEALYSPTPWRPTPPVKTAWGRTSVSLIGNNGEGEEISLTGFHDQGWSAIILQPGAVGLDMPPFALFSDDSPNLDGSIFRSARAAAREVMIPVYLHGIDRKSVNQLKRQLFQALNPRRGYTVLKFSEGDNTTRVLRCYYKGGMEGSETTDTAGFTWAKYGLTFTAMDPWFYDDKEFVNRYSFGTGTPFLGGPSFFPMNISSGVVGGAGGVELYNPGDAEAWPVWKLKGPIKSFSFTGPNGESVEASAPFDGSDLIAAGRTLTIDTRPGYKTVKDNTGVNYWPLLDTNPQFWSIEPGYTNAAITVVAGLGKPTVTLSFFPRYASFA